jgi:ERF superfamily
MSEDSKERTEFLQDLFKAYLEIQNPTKNAKNPFLKNSYADLGAVIDSVKLVLAKYQIMIHQHCYEDVNEQGVCFLRVNTVLQHVNGERDTSSVDVHMKELSPQGSMGAFTYGRRYGLLSRFSLAAEDDDGSTASGSVKTEEAILDKKTPEEAAKGIAGILNKKGLK